MLAPLPFVEREDHLPEDMPYRDTGCVMSPSCLRCPLERCRYDTPGGLTSIRRAARDVRILALRRDEMTVREIARATGLATRTIQRALRRNRL